MEKGFFKYYQSLPAWARGVVSIAAIGAVGLIGYSVYKKVKSLKEKKESNEVANSAEDEYIKLKKQGQKLSYPEPNYFAAANAIKNALNGCESIVGEKDAYLAVLSVVKKPIDWYYLINVFGSREIDDCGFGETVYALPELLSGQLGQLVPTGLGFRTTYSYLVEELKKRGVNV